MFLNNSQNKWILGQKTYFLGQIKAKYPHKNAIYVGPILRSKLNFLIDIIGKSSVLNEIRTLSLYFLKT